MIRGKTNDGRTMRIVFRTTIFGKPKIVLQGLGTNALGWSGWAHVGTFKGANALEEAKNVAKTFYGWEEE